jgi:hypothetical protein
MKDVIKMARESRLDVYGLGKDHLAFVAALQRFAVLVRADERAIAAPAQEFVCSTGLCHYKPASPVQEPVAWRTFDGEGGYEYRTYEMNEDYADDWEKRNPNHKGWVEPLYKDPTPCQTCEALARTVMMDQAGRHA